MAWVTACFKPSKTGSGCTERRSRLPLLKVREGRLGELRGAFELFRWLRFPFFGDCAFGVLPRTTFVAIKVENG